MTGKMFDNFAFYSMGFFRAPFRFEFRNFENPNDTSCVNRRFSLGVKIIYIISNQNNFITFSLPSFSEVSVSDINEDDVAGGSSKSNSVNSLQSTGISASSQVKASPFLNQKNCLFNLILKTWSPFAN
jgi:hypothetical protein